MSEALLAALNPGKKFDRAGETIFVANVRDHAGQAERSAGSRSTSRGRPSRRSIRSGALVAFFPATVGSEEKPTPSGTLKVVSCDANPNYRYNPDYKFKGVQSKRPFTIKPGPNNPVGSYWIGLSAEGYGIHGTPEPSKVSKSESHGCVRLTNWDAALLGSSIKKGTPVEFRRRPSARTDNGLSRGSDCGARPCRGRKPARAVDLPAPSRSPWQIRRARWCR